MLKIFIQYTNYKLILKIYVNYLLSIRIKYYFKNKNDKQKINMYVNLNISYNQSIKINFNILYNIYFIPLYMFKLTNF